MTASDPQQSTGARVPTSTSPPPSGLPLAERLLQLEALLRAKPTQHEHRWALFELLCVMGQWTRAVLQLKIWGMFHPGQSALVQAYRDLLLAEQWRAQVLKGQERPGLVLDAPPWMDGLLEALRLAAVGSTNAADDMREAALDAAPTTAGRHALGAFEWITDSDSRLGPVCEIVAVGRYRWLAIADLAAWNIGKPSTLLDLVWAPCTLTLIDGTTIRGFMPARYPDLDVNSEVHGHEHGDSDAIRLGHRTVWRESGRTGVIAAGRKTWSTNAGDYGLFELGTCTFGADSVAQSVAPRERA